MMVQTADSVELRLYDMQDREIMRLHEFAKLRFIEELVGGPGMLEAVISQELYDDLPDTGFAPARVFVRSEDTGEWECWWGGFVEEMNARKPDRSTCELVGQGWRRVLSWVGNRSWDYDHDLQPLRDATGATMPYLNDACGQMVADWIFSDMTERASYDGYYNTFVSAPTANMSTTANTQSDAVPAVTNTAGEAESIVDDVTEKCQLEDTPLLWWFSPGDGAAHIAALPAVTAAHLVEDTHLLDIDARRDTTDVVNRVGVHFSDFQGSGVIQHPYLTQNYFLNADFEDWLDPYDSAVAGATAMTDPFDSFEWGNQDPWCWACDQWMVAFGCGNAGFANLERARVTQWGIQPWETVSGRREVQRPRGLGDMSVRLELERGKAATGPLVCAVATAWNEWVTTPTEFSRLVDDRLTSGPWSATMSFWGVVGMEADGALSDAEYRWRLVTYDETGATVGATHTGWQAVAGATNTGEVLDDAALFTGVDFTAAGLYDPAATQPVGYESLYVQLALRGGDVVGDVADTMVVTLYGLKMEPDAGGATQPAVWSPDDQPHMWYDVESTQMGFATTSDQYQSITDYGLRYAEIQAPLPLSLNAAKCQDVVKRYLRSHSTPNWQIKGWNPERRRFAPQDGYVRLIGDADYCGAAYVLEKTQYDLEDSGAIIPTLHLGSPMRYRRPSEPVDAGDNYVPPTALPGSFGIPRYTRG